MAILIPPPNFLTTPHSDTIKSIAACAYSVTLAALFAYLFASNAHAQAATATATAVVATAATSVTAITAANPYGLAAIWLQGDWIAKLCLLLLTVMSIGSWYVLVAKWLELRRTQIGRASCRERV